MMLRRPLIACSRAATSTSLSSTTKSRAFSSLKPRAFNNSPKPVFSSIRPSNPISTISSLKPRAFNNSPKPVFSSIRPSNPISTISRLQRRHASFDTQPIPAIQSPLTKGLYAAGIFGASVLAINLVFNRETREGGIPTYEREYLHESFTYTGLGVGMIGLAAKALHNMGWSYKLMTMNPMMVMVIGVAGGIGTMMATRATPPENFVMKHTLWASFNLAQAAVLAPVFFYHPALIARAAVMTVAMMGSISYVGATAKTDQYLWIGGPLLGGLAVVIAASLAPMIMPRMMGARSLALAENISLYGGLAVFGGLTLYDVQKILKNARLSEAGLVPRDTVNESIALELDFINIFIRMLTILSNSQRRK